jgi:hypothetical protein
LAAILQILKSLNRKDKLSDSYSKQVEDLIENRSDLDFFGPIGQEELDESWEEISDQMDIDEVWSNISSDLDIEIPANSGSGIIFKTIAVVLIVLIGMISVKKPIPDSWSRKPGVTIENKQNKQPVDPIIKIKPGSSNTGEKANGDKPPALIRTYNKNIDIKEPTTTNNNRTSLTNEEPESAISGVEIKILAVSELTDSNLLACPDKILVERSDILPEMIPAELKIKKLLSEADFDSLEYIYNPPKSTFLLPLVDKRRISVGITLSFKNTWLLNNETMDGLKPESLNTTEISFYPDVGLSLNYLIKRNWSLQADGFLYSITGQEYHGYIHGLYSSKKITLKYSTIVLSVKYKIIGSGRFLNHYSINLLAGGYISLLHHADLKINTDLENIKSQYKAYDYGIRLGSEFELNLSDHLSLAPGLFVKLGLPNIYKGDDEIPGYFRRTYNLSDGFLLTFYYNFN